MSSNRSFKSSLELSTSASGSPLIARPDAVVGNSTQASIGHSQKHLLKKFAPPFERYQSISDHAIIETVVKLSVIVCTFNRSHLLVSCLDSLVNQTLPVADLEIVLVNNNSTDDTHAIAERYSGGRGNIRVINELKQGLSHARNRGWQEAKGKYVAYIDDDAKTSNDWTERIVHAFEKIKPEPDVVGGKIIPFASGPVPEWYPVDVEILSWGEQKRFLTGTEIQYGFFGSNMIFKKAILEENSGFSAQYGMQGCAVGVAEETEFFRRLSKCSPVLWYDPDIIVEHLISENNFDFRFMFHRCYKNGKALAEIEKSKVISVNYFKKILALFLFFLVRLDKRVKAKGMRGYLYIRMRLMGELLGYVLNTKRFR